MNADHYGARFPVKVCTNVSEMCCRENSTYHLQEIQPDWESSNNQMFSNQISPYFTVITYLPSTCAVAALPLCQIAPFSLFLLYCHSWTPASFALWIAGCPPLSPPLSVKPNPAFTSASQRASTNAGFQFPPDVKFQPSPRSPPPALGLASWAGKPSYAGDFVGDVCREAAVLFAP